MNKSSVMFVISMLFVITSMSNMNIIYNNMEPEEQDSFSPAWLFADSSISAVNGIYLAMSGGVLWGLLGMRYLVSMIREIKETTDATSHR